MAKANIEVTTDVRKALNGINTLSTGLKVAGAAAAGFVAVLAARGISSAVGELISLAAQQEVAVNKLNTALRLAGDFSDDASKDLQAFASQLQATSTIGDETTLEMLALAKSFGVSNEGAKELVQSAAELSEATGISLESAVKNLGKTFSNR